VIFRLNGTETLDWQELWCFRCEHEHKMTHGSEWGDGSDGCPLLLKMILGEDVPEFVPHGEDWWRTLPATVACTQFAACTQCPDDGPETERRGGETRREFHDRLRQETLALPMVEWSDG
jgi:hypothetical protein